MSSEIRNTWMNGDILIKLLHSTRRLIELISGLIPLVISFQSIELLSDRCLLLIYLTAQVLLPLQPRFITAYYSHFVTLVLKGRCSLKASARLALNSQS